MSWGVRMHWDEYAVIPSPGEPEVRLKVFLRRHVEWITDNGNVALFDCEENAKWIAGFERAQRRDKELVAYTGFVASRLVVKVDAGARCSGPNLSGITGFLEV